MKKSVLILAGAIFFSCHSHDQAKDRNKVYLTKDKLNVAKLTDTLVISESTCRGCAYEYTTHFDIDDSLGLVRLDRIMTTDSNHQDTAGAINKDLFLVPVRTGSTRIKLYKYYSQKPTAGDSAHYAVYPVEIKN